MQDIIYNISLHAKVLHTRHSVSAHMYVTCVQPTVKRPFCHYSSYGIVLALECL